MLSFLCSAVLQKRPVIFLFLFQGNLFLGLHPEGPNFYLDGRPFRILGGSFHYFRTQPAQWGDRLEKMKAAGLNTVTTYIPWNLHEKVIKSECLFSASL